MEMISLFDCRRFSKAILCSIIIYLHGEIKISRPPIASRELQLAFPARLRRKIRRNTIIRRLAEKGCTFQKKSSKDDLDVAHAKRKVQFAEPYAAGTRGEWGRDLQEVGDIKVFAIYLADATPR